MGVSTDAILCYGISFPEGYEFPWSGDEFRDDVESWWAKQTGFVPTNPEKLWDGEFEWIKTHPMPFEVVHHCSNECTMYILAVPSSVHEALRGHPKEINRGMLVVDHNELSAFRDFVDQHIPELDPEGEKVDLTPKWRLCSWWG